MENSFIYSNPFNPPLPQLKVYYTPDREIISLEIHEPGYPGSLNIPETLVHHLWSELKFDRSQLKTMGGERIELIHPGSLNLYEGPDFTGAKIRIGQTDFYGDVEIHCLSQSWYNHNHHTDPRYDNVILHVSLFPDLWSGKLSTSLGRKLPELILADFLTQSIRTLLYSFRISEAKQLPCSPFQHRIPPDLIRDTIQKQGILSHKRRFQRFKNAYLIDPDIHKILQRSLYRGMGFGPNKLQMEKLATLLPLSFILQFSNRKDLEAIHFGAAGLLPGPSDLLNAGTTEKAYVAELSERFIQIRSANAIHCMKKSDWHTFRLRPVNKPEFRIAQLISWLVPGGFFRGGILKLDNAVLMENVSLAVLQELLQVDTGPFWINHYSFLKASKRPTPGLGMNRLNKLIANSLLPYLLLKLELEERPASSRQIVDFLNRIPPENDQVIRIFRCLNTKPASMLESQALHALYKNGCSNAGCLECDIGKYILKMPPQDEINYDY